ncbi:hypothetical protein [Nocardia crassostreae]|uniref:hypothetical protein n=1 Tax=Nocardia crassostreae TaxID=53428 RepID=UPI00083178AF|nr:hypothetical protein [Nocardia crassostreae]
MTTVTAPANIARCAEALLSVDTTAETEIPTMFTRFVALLAAAGRAIPFHHDSIRWQLAGSTNVFDRDHHRTTHELAAIASMRSSDLDELFGKRG